MKCRTCNDRRELVEANPDGTGHVFPCPDCAVAEHFPGCHPEDAQGAQEPGHQPQDTEPCWHCGTPTMRGCACADCLDAADYMPPTAIYHCEVCGRWWAWMTGLNVIEIKFGAEEGAPS